MEEPKEKLGGGSGGGTGTDHFAIASGAYQIRANQVELLTQAPWPPTVPGPCVISVVADADLPGDGRVEVRGTQGVRITTGPVGVPPTSSESTNGVEIAVFQEQKVTIQCGGLPGVSPQIEMTMEGVTIDAGAAPLTIKSVAQITLSVAEGAATITLGPEGIQIQGALIEIN
jgi:hypothetical protein